jgi:hypothetical protein
VDIIITIDNFQTLAIVVIVDLTHTNLVQCVLTMTTHLAIVVTQDKTRSYKKTSVKK